MKQFTSSAENNWTASDSSLIPQDLRDKTIDLDLPIEQRREIAEQVKAAATVEVTETELADLQALYESVKPELKEGDEYQLIAIDASERNGAYTGILNCRVNGEHKQVRF